MAGSGLRSLSIFLSRGGIGAARAALTCSAIPTSSRSFSTRSSRYIYQRLSKVQGLLQLQAGRARWEVSTGWVRSSGGEPDLT